MITISKKLKGIFPYRVVVWPTESVVREIAENLPPTHAARIESASIELVSGRCVVDHYLSLTLAIDLRRDLEQLCKDLAVNARIRVHKAQKLGDRVTVRRFRGLPGQENLIEEFARLYNNFIAGQSYLFPITKAGISSYFPNAELILMDLDGQAICGHLNLLDKESGVSRMLWCASRRFEDHATARLAGILNVYLHWYEIEKYREEGFQVYDLGGIGSLDENVGVNRFKLQFGGTIAREHNYLMAGTPTLWRPLFKTFLTVAPRGRRQQQMYRATERWRQMPLERIQETIEASVRNFEDSVSARNRAQQHNSDQARS